MSKLFMVTIEYNVIVYAENESDADSVAQRNLKDITSNEEPNLISYSAPDAAMERIWAKSLPYGGVDNRSVQEILEETRGKP